MTLNIIIAIVTTVLSLINIFQLFDRRNRSKYLENSLVSVYDISQRMGVARGDDELVVEKSKDICISITGIIHSINGYNLGGKFENHRGNEVMRKKGGKKSEKTQNNLSFIKDWKDCTKGVCIKAPKHDGKGKSKD